jgi:transcriptional regulator GlxA family with amidase domain
MELLLLVKKKIRLLASNIRSPPVDRARGLTTHWYYAKEMQRRYPKIAAHEDRIFLIDGPVWTSAGMSAGIDLALALLADDLGADLVRVVAKILVVFTVVRAGSRSSRRCWIWTRNPIESRPRSLTRKNT